MKLKVLPRKVMLPGTDSFHLTLAFGAGTGAVGTTRATLASKKLDAWKEKATKAFAHYAENGNNWGAYRKWASNLRKAYRKGGVLQQEQIDFLKANEFSFAPQAGKGGAKVKTGSRLARTKELHLRRDFLNAKEYREYIGGLNAARTALAEGRLGKDSAEALGLDKKPEAQAKPQVQAALR